VKSPPRRAPESLGTLLPAVLRELGLDETARVLRIAQRWEESLGSELAQRCRPQALRGDVLEVSVESSVWSQQLHLRIPEILEALRRVLGDDAPSKLRLRVG
jgi:predicted nucleic acid-binding Zn ribbon protein